MEDKVTYTTAYWTQVNSTKLFDASSLDYWVHTAVLQHVNDKTPGWENIRILNTSLTRLGELFTTHLLGKMFTLWCLDLELCIARYKQQFVKYRNP